MLCCGAVTIIKQKIKSLKRNTQSNVDIVDYLIVTKQWIYKTEYNQGGFYLLYLKALWSCLLVTN